MRQQKKSQENYNNFRIKTKPVHSKPQRIGHYQIGQLIGKGGFANVHRAIEMNTKKQVAIKIVNLDILRPNQVEHIRKQIFIHSKLSHPNIVKIYEAIWTENEAYIIMEYVKGFELFSYLSKFGALPEAIAAKIFYQMVNATQYLHSLNIAHRDIKTQNIIIDFDFNAKLLDFGLAKSFKSSEDDHLITLCGSPSYIAPQILHMKGYSGQRVDIWCLGVTLYVMLQARLPFEEPDDHAREKNIKNMNWHYPLKSSAQARQIYRQIFVEQDQRISIEGIKDSLFLQSYNIFESSLSKSNHKRQSYTSQIKIIQKICKILRVKEAEVMDVIQNKKIGQIFCLYNLLSNSPGALDQEQQKRKCQSEQKSPKTIVIQEDKKSARRAKTKPKQAICAQKIKVIFPNVFDTKTKTTATTSRKQQKATITKLKNNDKLFEDFLVEDSLVDKQKFTKQTIGSRASKFRSGKQQMKIITPRFRNNSQESPKRILDCVKRYN